MVRRKNRIRCKYKYEDIYTLSEAWSGGNWADLLAAQDPFGTDFYDSFTRTTVGTMRWTEYRPVIKIGLKCALGSHEIRPIHSAPSLGQSIGLNFVVESKRRLETNDLLPTLAKRSSKREECTINLK